MSNENNDLNEIKILDYMTGELSEEEMTIVRQKIDDSRQLKKEVALYEEIIASMKLDKQQQKNLDHLDHLDQYRKDKIFNQKLSLPNTFNPMFFKWALPLAAALLLVVGGYHWTNKDGNNIDNRSAPETNVLGFFSFNLAMPSGTYWLTVKNNILTIDRIEKEDGVDYFNLAEVQVGDQLLEISNRPNENMSKEQWKSFLIDQLKSENMVIKIKRNDVLLPVKMIQQK